MHPGFIGWWKHARGEAFCGPGAEGFEGYGGREFAERLREHAHRSHEGRSRHGFGPGEHTHRGHGGDERFASGEDDLGAGFFGVRRPLRFLAFKLELRDEQVTELAGILNDLKTERAQAAVDARRTTAALADAMAATAFDEAKIREAGSSRVQSAERLRDAVSSALSKIHALLDEEQRKRFAYLLRTGVISI